MKPINNFTVMDSVYGQFIVNRHCDFQADALIKTGRPHIDEEIQTILGFVERLPDRAFFLDAGANIGMVSIPVAQMLKARGGMVLAFEVQRMLHYALAGAAALNDLTNLIAINQGLGAEMGDRMIAVPDYGAPQDFGTFSLLEAQPQQEGLTIITVDSLQLPRLDFLKIDVEGMELDVLAGARQTIARHRPWCWVEDWIIGRPAIEQAFATHPDYDFYNIDNMNLLCAPKERLAASGITIQRS
jgi:FkbM family methyltransferase